MAIRATTFLLALVLLVATSTLLVAHRRWIELTGNPHGPSSGTRSVSGTLSGCDINVGAYTGTTPPSLLVKQVVLDEVSPAYFVLTDVTALSAAQVGPVISAGSPSDHYLTGLVLETQFKAGNPVRSKLYQASELSKPPYFDVEWAEYCHNLSEDPLKVLLAAIPLSTAKHVPTP